MNLLEHEIHYPLADAMPQAGSCLEVAPGVKWIRMSLPFALNHINLWLLRDSFDDGAGARQGWTVIDCCVASDSSRAQWEQIFAEQLEGLPIVRVLVTHMHPDHIGLAHWLCSRWQAPLWISATDYHVALVACKPPASHNLEGGARYAAFYQRHGLDDPEFLQHVLQRTAYYPQLVPDLPDSFRRLMDRDRIQIGGRSWECIAGYGHAPEHMALYCAELQLLISGDMVLPRISTNVSVHANEPQGDPLGWFLDSLQRYLPLPEDTLVLPSHGKPFQGLHTRIHQLEDHHAERLDEVRAACALGPTNAAKVMQAMFRRPLNPHEQTFALGEALAHLNYLWRRGEITRHDDGDCCTFTAVTA